MTSDCKNLNWDIPKSKPDGRVSFDGAQLAVLMDIRHELTQLNNVIGCRNFLAVPQLLRDIKRNTSKPNKRKAK